MEIKDLRKKRGYFVCDKCRDAVLSTLGSKEICNKCWEENNSNEGKVEADVEVKEIIDKTELMNAIERATDKLNAMIK